MMLVAAPHLWQCRHMSVKMLLERRISPYNLGTEGTKMNEKRSPLQQIEVVYSQKEHL